MVSGRHRGAYRCLAFARAILRILRCDMYSCDFGWIPDIASVLDEFSAYPGAPSFGYSPNTPEREREGTLGFHTITSTKKEAGGLSI